MPRDLASAEDARQPLWVHTCESWPRSPKLSLNSPDSVHLSGSQPSASLEAERQGPPVAGGALRSSAPMPSLPPQASSTAASLAAAARRCEALRQARRLASWVGEGKRVTPKHVLRPIDVPAAAQVLAIAVPPRMRTAAAVPALHRTWKVALAAGFLRIVDGQAVIGPALGQWPDADDNTVRELWLTGLTAAFAASSSSDDDAGAVAILPRHAAGAGHGPTAVLRGFLGARPRSAHVREHLCR